MNFDSKAHYLERPDLYKTFDETDNVADLLMKYSNKYPNAIVYWVGLNSENFENFKSLKYFIRNSLYDKTRCRWYAACHIEQSDLIQIDIEKNDNYDGQSFFIIFKNEEE